jgi:hypothetical protein
MRPYHCSPSERVMTRPPGGPRASQYRCVGCVGSYPGAKHRKPRISDDHIAVHFGRPRWEGNSDSCYDEYQRCGRLRKQIDDLFNKPVRPLGPPCPYAGGTGECRSFKTTWINKRTGRKVLPPAVCVGPYTHLDPKKLGFSDYEIHTSVHVRDCYFCGATATQRRRRSAFDELDQWLQREPELAGSVPMEKLNVRETTEEKECDICGENGPQVIFHCNHSMCPECSEQWFARSASCHMCRANLCYQDEVVPEIIVEVRGDDDSTVEPEMAEEVVESDDDEWIPGVGYLLDFGRETAREVAETVELGDMETPANEVAVESVGFEEVATRPKTWRERTRQIGEDLWTDIAISANEYMLPDHLTFYSERQERIQAARLMRRHIARVSGPVLSFGDARYLENVLVEGINKRLNRGRVGGEGMCWMRLPFLSWDATLKDTDGMNVQDILDKMDEQPWLYQNALERSREDRKEVYGKYDFFVSFEERVDGLHILGSKKVWPLKNGSIKYSDIYGKEYDEAKSLWLPHFADALQAYLDKGGEDTVGSAVELVAESMRINGPEIAKMAATDQFNNDLASTPTTKYRMSAATQAAISKEFGFPIHSKLQVANHNDHLVMEVARELVRVDLKRRMPHNTDFSRTVHIGCTMHEVKTWLAHPGHDFVFHLSESKDLSRMYTDLVHMIGSRFANLTLPSCVSRAGNTTVLTIKDLDEAFSLLQVGGRRRFFVSLNDASGPYDCAIMEDCRYDMTAQEFGEMVDKFKLKTAYSIDFAPWQLLSKDVAPSLHYRYKEYVPGKEEVIKAFESVWPSVLILSPLLPLHGIAGVVHDAIHTCLSKGLEWSHDLASRLVSDQYPLEMMFGVGFDLLKFAPIVRQLLKHLVDHMNEELLRVSIVWKGTSNGYDHHRSRWRNNLIKRRYERPSGLYFDSEVVCRIGEMWLTKFWTSDGTSPIVYTIDLPLNKQVVYLADVVSAYNKTRGVLEDLVYKPFCASDFYSVLLWALAEPVESLTFNVIATMVNRVRGGLSLASNVLVQPMELLDQDVQHFAVAILMEVYQRQDTLRQIQENEDLAKGYQTNAERIIKMLAKAFITIASGGLAVPAYYIYKWLMDSRPDYVFVKFPNEPEIIKIKGKGKGLSGGSAPLLGGLQVVIPHKKLQEKSACYICQLHNEGTFSADGKPESGQQFQCHKAGADNLIEIGFGASEAAVLEAYVRDNRSAHEALGASKLLPVIKRLEDFVGANNQGVQKKVTIDHIMGGPGTGKTEVIKAYALKMKTRGETVNIVMPFKELVSDYKETSVLGATGKHTFVANTTWYAIREENQSILIVDECTGMDWRFIKLLAIYQNVNKIILVGDRKQTCLNSQAGEGTDPTNPASGLDWEKIPEHCLVYNYRLDAWRVKLLNLLFGYKMIAKRNDELPIKFVTKKTYNMLKSKENIVKESVFAHLSAPVIFGCDSKAGDGVVPNMSVRSSQGKTYKGSAAISIAHPDVCLLETQGMVCVAISRSTGQLYVVAAESVEDDHVSNLAKYLYCDTPDAVSFVSNLPVPGLDKKTETFSMTLEEEILDNKIRKMAEEQNAIQVLKSAEDENDRTYTAPLPKRICLDFRPEEVLVLDEPQYPLWDFFKKEFNFCFFQAFIDQFGEEEVKSKVYDWLVDAYMDDGLMGRPKACYIGRWEKFFKTSGAKVRPWQRINGKLTPSLNQLVTMARKHFTEPVIFLYELKIWIHVPQSLKKPNLPDHTFCLAYKDNHIVRYIPDRLVCRRRSGVNESMSEMHQLAYIGENPVNDIANRFVYQLKQKKIRNQWVTIIDDLVTVVERGVVNVVDEPTIEDVLRDDLLMQFDLNVPVGVTPSIVRVNIPETSRETYNLMTNNAPLVSSWKNNPVKISSKFHQKTPFRYGTDGYRLHSLIDPSRALRQNLNEAGIVQGPQELSKTIQLNPTAFAFSRTAGGKLKPMNLKSYRSFQVGYGSHFGDSPAESLIASQRVGKNTPKRPLTRESKAWAHKIVDEYFERNWLPVYRQDPLEYNRIIEGAIKACVQRNYDGRRRANQKKDPSGKLKLVASNKCIFKVKGEPSITKIGQLLLQTPPAVNQEYLGTWRVHNNLMKRRAKDDFFLDDYEDTNEFRIRLTRKLCELPSSARFGIFDLAACDSQQGPVTVEMEKRFAFRMHGLMPHIDFYYDVIRGSLPFLMYGVFSGRTKGEKGSGFPDTKSGNTNVSGPMSNRVLRGTGPSVRAGKGDDGLICQSGMKFDEKAAKEIFVYSGVTIKAEVSDGGDFIGTVVNRKGMFPSVKKTALKFIGNRSRDYKHFADQQQALRDFIDEVRQTGIEETIGYSAEAVGIGVAYFQACLAFINSAAHISMAQWFETTRRRTELPHYLPGVWGPRLV